MASIAEWIEKIKTAIYGEEVRGAIWQSLDAMNTQVDAINVDSAQIEQNKQNIATNTAAITALNSRLPHLNYINASSFEEATSLQTATYLNIIDVLGTVDSPNSSYNRWFGFQYLNGTKKYGFQIAFSFGISALYMRRRNNSDTWTEWTAIQ